MVSDNGNLEALSQHIATLSERNSRHKLLIGVLLSRAEKRYGAGTVTAVSNNTGVSRASLYEYQQTERKLRGRKMSAARILREMPNLHYSHLRAATRFLDLETRYLELVEASEKGMSADAFSVAVSKKLGKRVPAAPVFDEQGVWVEVDKLAHHMMQGRAALRVRVTIREIE